MQLNSRQPTQPPAKRNNCLIIGGIFVGLCVICLVIGLISNALNTATPQPTTDINSIIDATQTSAALTISAPLTLTAQANPNASTDTPVPTYLLIPSPIGLINTYLTVVASPQSNEVQNTLNTSIAPPTNSHPLGTSGLCVDKTYTSASHEQGACSHHGGVASWWGWSPTPTITEILAGSNNTPVAPSVASGDSPDLPNPVWQPGADNPNVTQDNIQSTICVSGYTSKIRPPVSYTDNLKVQQIMQYRYADTNPADYEEDHLIPLEVGGDPTNPKNLWPEPRYTAPYNASTKDTLENTLHKMVCEGQLPLDTARQAIATDWVAAYRQYVSQSIILVTGVPTEP